MKILPITLIILIAGFSEIFAQQTYYDVTSGNGNGLRFWSSDSYKIHMGNTSEYKYGPVTDYSIKMNMTSTTGRGWTWGQPGLAPIAAISNVGNMQIAGSFTASKMQGTSFETIKTSYTKIELAQHDWSGSHALFFNAYKSISVSGSLLSAGNTKYANSAGSYGGGAGAIIFNGNGGSMYFCISPVSTGLDQDINWGTPKMYINRLGQIGIGTTSVPSGYTMAVDGKVIMEEARVAVSSNWSDFVFDQDYDLPTLQEVETYIDQNGHLPDIPSTEEVEENGISLGEMDAKLLQKIEELMLYVIELKKENAEMKKEIIGLKQNQTNE
jgi:hypothetical protein